MDLLKADGLVGVLVEHLDLFRLDIGQGARLIRTGGEPIHVVRTKESQFDDQEYGATGIAISGSGLNPLDSANTRCTRVLTTPGKFSFNDADGMVVTCFIEYIVLLVPEKLA